VSCACSLPYLWGHPLGPRPLRQHANCANAAWQLRLPSRPGPVVMPYFFSPPPQLAPPFGGIAASPRATGNLYCACTKPDMAFVLHCSAPGDTFADIGANVGSYNSAGLRRGWVPALWPLSHTPTRSALAAAAKPA